MSVACPIGNLRSLDRILTNLHVPEDLPVRNLVKASREPVEWLYYCYFQYGGRIVFGDHDFAHMWV